MAKIETDDRGGSPSVENGKPAPSPQKAPNWLLVFNLVYVMAVVALSVYNSLGPEHWWFVALNLYLPQALWLIPGLFLLILNLVIYRRLALLSAAVLCWIAGPVMGFTWHAPAPNTGRAPGTLLRVMTYNVKWGVEDPAAIVQDINKFSPDLVVMQDSAGVLQTPVGPALDGWDIQTSGQFTIASRVPISKLDSIDVSYAGSNHHAVRFRVLVGGMEVTVYTTHLLSPRNGLINVRHHHLKPFLANVDDRVTMGRLLRDTYLSDQAASPGPAIVMGDLNSPIQSLVCKRFLGAGLHDAYSDAGFGYGYTYGAKTIVGFSYMRIDHIFANNRLKVTGCWVGNDIGSDHRPVIADLAKA